MKNDTSKTSFSDCWSLAERNNGPFLTYSYDVHKVLCCMIKTEHPTKDLIEFLEGMPDPQLREIAATDRERNEIDSLITRYCGCPNLNETQKEIQK